MPPWALAKQNHKKQHALGSLWSMHMNLNELAGARRGSGPRHMLYVVCPKSVPFCSQGMTNKHCKGAHVCHQLGQVASAGGAGEVGFVDCSTK